MEPQQKHRLGTISNIELLWTVGGGGGGGLEPVLQAPNLTLIFCSGSQHILFGPRGESLTSQ